MCERRCTDRLRRRSRRQGRELSLDGRHEASPERADSWPINAGEARAAVAALPVAQRTALTLANLENLPLEEASARSGMSVGAPEVAMHRAKRLLRRRLRAAEDVPGGCTGGA